MIAVRGGARRVVAAVMVLLVGGCTATHGVAGDGAPSASPTPEPTPTYKIRSAIPAPAPGKVIYGSFLELHGRSQAASLGLRRQQLGRDPRIIHWYYAWEDVLPASFRGVPDGATVMLSWRGPRYAQVLDGSQDKHIRAVARNLARYREPIYLRFAWEMNGSWYRWGGKRNGEDPAAFVAVWKRIHDLFRKQGADNVIWVWAPNHASHPREPWNDVANYYPGDGYVDWVGVSAYSRDGPAQLLDPVYRAYAQRKPFMLAETGLRRAGARQAADWIDALAAWLADHPGACAVVWFDTDNHKRGTNEFTDFRVDRDPAVLAAFRRMVNDPRFDG
jgi:hypothetical protein